MSARLPHPIPYQGSKRNLAATILAVVNGRKVRRLYEPRPDELATLDTLGAASHGKAIHELVRLTKRLGETV